MGGGGGGPRESGPPPLPLPMYMKNDVMRTVIYLCSVLHVIVLGFASLHIVLAKGDLYRSNVLNIIND